MGVEPACDVLEGSAGRPWPRQPAKGSAIPPGAKLATIAQAGLALGVSRGTINKLMNDGTLVRKMLGKRAVRIETASIWAFAGTAS